MEKTKKCSVCGEEKPATLEYFHKQTASKDGLFPICKECRKVQGKKYYEKNKDLILQKKKVYHQENREVILQKQKAWREENAELHRQRSREYYWEHRDECIKRHKAFVKNNPDFAKRYYEEHKEWFKEWCKKWKEKNPDKIRVYTHRKRAKRQSLLATLTTKQWQIIKDYFNNKCCYCGKELPLEQEHFIPVAQDGVFTHNNIIPACRSCNLSKSAHSFFVWYPQQPFYAKKREKAILNFLGYANQDTQQPMLLI